MWRIAVAGLVTMIGAGTAAAADIGNAETGREISGRWCSSCHDITGTLPRASDGPPSFVTIANRAETTAAGLRAFLHTPHAQMPDLALSRDDTAHVITYILGLKRR